MKNVDLMLQCDECSMWRLLYSRFKLTRKERADMQVAIDDISFTCGAPLQDLQLPGRLSEVYTRELSCGEPIEKLYYTAKYTPICIYCADDVESVPQCLQRQARNHEDIDVCIVYLLFCTAQSHVHVCMAIFEILPFMVLCFCY